MTVEFKNLDENPVKTADRRSYDAQTQSGIVGIERYEARVDQEGFERHRHDTYGIGLTLSGVQSFSYRGARWCSLPGQCQFLHPDEVHDGAAGSSEDLTYRILYIAPSLVQAVVKGRPLPFVAEPVVSFSPSVKTKLANLWTSDEQLDEVGAVDATVLAVEAIEIACGIEPEQRPLPIERLERVRDMIAADPAICHRLDEFENLSGLDRWALARHFRAAFGTSPTRFRTFRQLDLVRRQIRLGESLAIAALQAGFSDQSHMTRQFKCAFGLSPARWASAVR